MRTPLYLLGKCPADPLNRPLDRIGTAVFVEEAQYRPLSEKEVFRAIMDEMMRLPRRMNKSAA